MEAMIQLERLEQQSTIDKLQRRIEQYKEQLRAGGQTLLESERVKQVVSSTPGIFQTVEEEERFLLDLQREIDWLGAELQAMQNHLHLLEARTISFHPMGLDCFDDDMGPGHPIQGLGSVVSGRSLLLSSLWEELKVEVDLTQKFYGIAKSRNDKLEDLIRTHPDEVVSLDVRLGNSNDSWSPIPSPNLEPPDVDDLLNFSSGRGRDKSRKRSTKMPKPAPDTLQVDTEDECSSIAMSTPNSELISPLGVSQGMPKPPPFYDETGLISSGSVSAFGRSSQTSMDESVVAYKQPAKKAVGGSGVLRSGQRSGVLSATNSPRDSLKGKEDGEKKKFETLVWRGPRKPRGSSSMVSSDNDNDTDGGGTPVGRDPWQRTQSEIQRASGKASHSGLEGRSVGAGSGARKPVEASPEARVEKVLKAEQNVGNSRSPSQAERGINRWQATPKRMVSEPRLSRVAVSRSAILLPRDYSEFMSPAPSHEGGASAAREETVKEEVLETVLDFQWEAEAAAISKQQKRRMSLDNATKVFPDSPDIERKAKSKKWGLTYLKGLAKGWLKKREANKPSGITFTHRLSSDSPEGSVIHHPSPEGEVEAEVKLTKGSEVLEVVKAPLVIEEEVQEVEPAEPPEVVPAVAVELPKRGSGIMGAWSSRRSKSAIFVPKIIQSREEGSTRAKNRLLGRIGLKNLTRVEEAGKGESKEGKSAQEEGKVQPVASARSVIGNLNVSISHDEPETEHDLEKNKSISSSSAFVISNPFASIMSRTNSSKDTAREDASNSSWFRTKSFSQVQEDSNGLYSKQMNRRNILKTFKGSDLISLPSKDPEKGWRELKPGEPVQTFPRAHSAVFDVRVDSYDDDNGRAVRDRLRKREAKASAWPEVDPADFEEEEPMEYSRPTVFDQAISGQNKSTRSYPLLVPSPRNREEATSPGRGPRSYMEPGQAAPQKRESWRGSSHVRSSSRDGRDSWRGGQRSKSGVLGSYGASKSGVQSGYQMPRSGQMHPYHGPKSGQLLGYAMQRRSGQLMPGNLGYSLPQRTMTERYGSWSHADMAANESRTNWDLDEIVSNGGSRRNSIEELDWDGRARERLRRRNFSGSFQSPRSVKGSRGKSWAANLLKMGSRDRDRDNDEYLDDMTGADEDSFSQGNVPEYYNAGPSNSFRGGPEVDYSDEMELASQYWRRPTELAEMMLNCMANVYRLSSDANEPFDSPLKSELGVIFPRLPSRTFSGPMRPSKTAQFVKTDPDDPYNCLRDHPCGYSGDYSKMVSVLKPPVSHRQTPEQVDGLRQYESLVQQLSTVDPSTLAHEEKLAFWINLLNSILMHTFTIHGPPHTLSGRRAILSKSFVNVGGCTISALEIEHSILRVHSRVSLSGNGNTSRSSTFIDKFDPMDMRSRWVLDRPEPLVIFAMCPGSRSGPGLRVYSAANVRSELEKARVMFLLASVGFTEEEKVILPKILEWHSSDFVSDSSNLVDWVVRGIPDPQRFILKRAVARLKQENEQPVYETAPYDWSFRYLIEPA